MIATQLQQLSTDRQNISAAITAKGGTVAAGDGFDNFASDIATIPTGGEMPELYGVPYDYIFPTLQNNNGMLWYGHKQGKKFDFRIDDSLSNMTSVIMTAVGTMLDNRFPNGSTYSE